MAEISYNRSLPVRHEVDVLVVGGGPAGCAAAVAAARQGAKVFLVEAQGCLGGLGTAGMVPAYMCFSDGENFCAAGIGEEILHRMWEYGNYGDFDRPLSIRVEALKRVYDDLLLEAGVDFVFHTQLVDVLMDGQKIDSCVFASKSGMYAVKAKVYIDGTGDADVAAWAGAPFKQGDENGKVMASTLCSLWAGIDFKNAKKGPDNQRIEEAYNDGVFEKLDMHLPGMWKITESIGGGNIGHVYDVDGTDERSLTKGLIDGRKLYSQYEEYYKKYLTGYENMEMVMTGAILGIRETRRIEGDYVLVLQDFLDRAVFDDEIGRYCYPVDIHASNNSMASFKEFMKDHTGYRYQKGENYGVPYRIMLPKNVENLYVTGRSVSTDRYMQSSIRVMPGCYITGQAAGVGAALCAKEDKTPRTVDVHKVQKILKDMGAYLPNFKE